MPGRPTKMTKQRLGKLKQAFLLGCTDEEACLNAGIHPDTLYAYQNRNPEYSDEKKQYKMNPILLARKTVLKAIETDSRLAFKYLERRKKDEFSLKREIDIDHVSEPITGIEYIVPVGETP